MERYFDEELHKVKKHLLEMASLVEEAITKSLTAVERKDLKMAEGRWKNNNLTSAMLKSFASFFFLQSNVPPLNSG